MTRIDLNADLGESFGAWTLGDDAAMLDLVSSANIACGFHAGDPRTLLRCCELAAARGVAIGAQVGYRDLAGFGRRFIEMDPVELTAEVIYQIGALDALARAAGSRVRYVKPHGALYNAIVSNAQQAAAVVEAVRRVDPSLPVLGLPGSVFLTLAEQAGLPVIPEAFADRAYTAAGTLVPRGTTGAVLADPQEVAGRAVRMVTQHRVTAADGTDLELAPESICVHGDSPGAVLMAQAVRAALAAAEVTVAPFVAG